MRRKIKRGGGRQMKQDMRSVWDHSIAHRQEGMRFAEHDLIASFGSGWKR
jgi:hypothetical protein